LYARYSRFPGIDTINDLHKKGQLPPTTMWFGDKDWMDNEAAKKEMDNLGLDQVVKYEIIPKSGHQIVFNNPVEIAKKITEDYKFEWKHIEPMNKLDSKTMEIRFTD
jgi:pimeloyl-ACP methyl ester carboxylesterase